MQYTYDYIIFLWEISFEQIPNIGNVNTVILSLKILKLHIIDDF